MDSTTIQRTPSSSGSNTVFTMSMWIKRAGLGAAQCLWSNGGSPQGQMSILAGDDLIVYDGASTVINTNRLFRDPGAWYHIVLACDAGATGNDKVKLYINGVFETSFATDNRSSFSDLNNVNQSGEEVSIGSNGASGQYFDGGMAHVNFTDGTAYAASAFGETDSTSGIWIAKTSPSVTYGTNGYFLKFQDTSAFGDDSSGNTNDFTVSGTITQTKDTPDDNFCTMNPLSAGVINGAGMPLTTGNTTIYDGDANWRSGFGTIGDNQGKYYFEAKAVGSSTNWWIGFLDARQVVKGEYKFTAKTRGYGVSGAGNKGNSDTEVSWGVTYAQNDIAMCALDLDNGKIYFGKNGTWSESGDPTSGSTGTGSAYSVTTDCIYLPAVGLYDTTAGMSLNFGNGYFGTTAVASAGTNASGIGTFE